MMQSKPSLRSGFDCIIRPAPSGAGRTTPSQPGHYPLSISWYYIYIHGWDKGSHSVCIVRIWEKMDHRANRPVAQIPQYTSIISHNAPFCNRNMHICAHFCYKMMHCGICTYVHISVTKWCIVGYDTGALWDLWYWSILGLHSAKERCRYKVTPSLIGWAKT